LGEITDVEQPSVRFAEKNGWLALKLNNPWCRGYPDRLYVGYEYHIYIEYKIPGKKPSKLQWKRINDLRKRGAFAFWSDNKEFTKEILKYAMETRRRSIKSVEYDDESGGGRFIC